MPISRNKYNIVELLERIRGTSSCWPRSTSGESCRNSGRKHMIAECHAYGKTSNSCHKKSHFEKYCLPKQNKSAMNIHTVGVSHDVNLDVET